MTCREIGPWWQGEMDFGRDKDRRNMVGYRLEIKMERQYRIQNMWIVILFYLFSTFFDVLSPLFQFAMQRIQKQFHWQSWIHLITTVPPPEMECTGTASQAVFLRVVPNRGCSEMKIKSILFRQEELLFLGVFSRFHFWRKLCEWQNNFSYEVLQVSKASFQKHSWLHVNQFCHIYLSLVCYLTY